MEKEVFHYEDEDLIIYRCTKCHRSEKHHYPKERKRPRWPTLWLIPWKR